jgi:hypothetical protein
MHPTLKPKTNLVLMVVWLTVLSMSLAFSQSKSLTVVCCGVVIGAIAGFMQFRAITKTAQQLISATTALQVRKALWGNILGKLSIYLLWIYAIALFGFAFGSQIENPLITLVAGYSAFALVREAVALPALLKLATS